MGVKLRDIVEPKNINIKNLEERTVAIDAYNTLYQFLSGIRQRDGTPLTDPNGNVTSHLTGLLYRNTNMIDKGIKPIYVFDGKPSEYKSETIKQRREVREESHQKWKEALEKGDEATARKYAIRSSKMTPEIIKSSKKLLSLMGIPYVDAYGEGEAQAAYMVKNGDAWAVASQDYDCLLFGSEKIVRNLTTSNSAKSLEYYELKNVLKELKISREELVDLSLLVGTDFNDGMKGVGAKTGLKYAKNGKLPEKMKELQKDCDTDIDTLREIFLNPKVNKNYKIDWKKPDKNGVIDFLCDEHGFSANRVIRATDKLKNLNSGQKSLEAWF